LPLQKADCLIELSELNQERGYKGFKAFLTRLTSCVLGSLQVHTLPDCDFLLPAITSDSHLLHTDSLLLLENVSQEQKGSQVNLNSLQPVRDINLSKLQT